MHPDPTILRESLALLAARYRRRRLKARTRRILKGLSPAILRDIGWPDLDDLDERIRQ